jgi:glycosyltransferase involved in cell wall biosynthesis
MTRPTRGGQPPRTPARPARVLLMVENVALARDHRLRKHAAALVAAGMRVTVICRRDPGNRAVPGVRVLDYPAPAEGSGKLGFVGEYLYSLLMAAVLTVRAVLTGGVDVVQMSSTPDIYFVLAVPLKLCGRRVVFDFKDLSPEMYEARYGSADGPLYRLLRLCERVSLRTATHVLAVNDAVRTVAMTRGAVPPQRISVVGNGPRLDEFVRGPARPELRRGHRHLAVLIGMMGPQDRIDLAVEAVAHLVHRIGRTDCAVAFVGVGDAVPHCARLAAERGLSDWVSFPGWAEHDRVIDYLSTADLGLEPNLEPFVTPVKAMEYMAVGLPFVAFDVAETRLVGGGAAALARPGDPADFARHIDALLSDRERRLDMGWAGRRAVAGTLAWEQQQKTYVALVGRLAGHRAPDSAQQRTEGEYA